MELAREHFDKTVVSLYKKFDKKIDRQTVEMKAYSDKQIEKLARMVADGFKDVQTRLDVTDRLAKVEQKFAKIEEALHIQL